MFTVIACVALMTAGIVGATKMEERLGRSETQRVHERN